MASLSWRLHEQRRPRLDEIRALRFALARHRADREAFVGGADTDELGHLAQSITTDGKVKGGTRLCPPARTALSEPCSAPSASASSSKDSAK